MYFCSGIKCACSLFISVTKPWNISYVHQQKIFTRLKWMNEWMMHLYSAFIVYCHTPKALYNHVGGVSPQPPPVCSIHLDDATAATGQRRQCAHHTPATGGEEREIEPIKWMGIIRRPWLTRASGGKLPGHQGYTPTLYEKCHGIFNDHRESGPRFNVSSERRCFLQYSVPVAILGR